MASVSRDGKQSKRQQQTQAEDSHSEKLLPSNHEMEASLIGSLLWACDGNADGITQMLAELSYMIEPQDFDSFKYRDFYRAAFTLYENGTPVDLILWNDELLKLGLVDMGGQDGTYSSADLTQCMVLPGLQPRNWRYYAQRVKECAALRRWIAAAGTVAGIAYNTPDLEAALPVIEAELQAARELSTRLTAGDLFTFLSDEEAEAIQPARGILGNLLYEGTLAVLYGQSGRWKSFLALAWALSIATGRDWLGRKVVEGDVVYIAAEGGLGIGKRITAWKRHHGITGSTRVHVLPQSVQLLDDAQLQRLILSIQKLANTPVLIVVDTLARSMAGGDENSGKDGSRAIAAADKLREAFGCCVLLVAHPGKDDSRGLRGWSGYFAAADIVIRAASSDSKPRLDPGDLVTLTSEKPKDTEPFAEIAITTERLAWATEDAQIVSSLVIVDGSAAKAQEREKPLLTDGERRALAELHSESNGLGYMEWMRACGYDRKSGTFNRTRTRLLDLGFIRDLNGRWHSTVKGAEYLRTAGGTSRYQSGTTVPSGTNAASGTSGTTPLRGVVPGTTLADAIERPMADAMEGA